MRAAAVARIPYPVATAVEAQDLVAFYSGVGTIPSIVLNGVIFTLDAADTTTAHDGVSCLVTFDGRRYKTDTIGRAMAIEAQQSTPPGSPTLGLAWLVGASPTGAWAGQADRIAMWTSRGWLFLAPSAGMRVFDKALNGDWQYNNAATWVFGLTPGNLAAGSITVPMLAVPFGVAVEAQQNTPPGTVAGTFIVGTSPTGAWSGWAGSIAVAISGSWTRVLPYEGATVFNRGTASDWEYVGGVWADRRNNQGWTRLVRKTRSATSLTVGLNYAYSRTTAPTTSNTTAEHADLDLTNVDVNGALMRFRYAATIFPDSSGFSDLTVALFRDSETNARVWWSIGNRADGTPFRMEVTLELVANDSLSHTYRIRLARNVSNNPVFQDRILTLEQGIAL